MYSKIDIIFSITVFFMSQLDSAPKRGFGWNQYINFGKHKGKNFYDLANVGDFKYLTWCLRNDLTNAKDPNTFFIADSCIPHIRAALSVEGIKVTPWIKEYSQPNEEGKMELTYVCHDQTRDYIYKGPVIDMKQCANCNQIKNMSLFNIGEGRYCSKCYTEMDLKRTTRITYSKSMHDIENEKGNKESYQNKYPKPKYPYATGTFNRKPYSPPKLPTVNEPANPQ